MSPASLNIGSILSRTFSTVKENPAVFLGTAMLAALPDAVISFLAAGYSDSKNAWLFSTVISSVLYLVVQGAIAHAVYRCLRREHAAVGESVSRGTAHLIPILVASILSGFGVVLGFAALLVPGLILCCMWSVAIPACVVERLGPIQSMSRSAAPTLARTTFPVIKTTRKEKTPTNSAIVMPISRIRPSMGHL